MRFTAPKDELLHGVQVASKALPTTSAEAMLLDVLLEARDGALQVFATNNRISIRHKLPAQIQEPGSVAVRGGLFNELLQGLASTNAQQVEIVTDERNRLSILSGGASYDIGGDDPKGFPFVPPFQGGATLNLPTPELRGMLRQVAVVAGGGLTGQTFEEVSIGVEQGRLVMVSTDSVRLAIRRWTPPEGTEVPALDLRVPIHALQELGKVLSGEGDTTMQVGEDAIAFHFGGTEFRSRLSDRPFPNYKQILPKSSAMRVEVDAKAFSDALKGTLPLARETKQKVHLKFAEDELEVLCVSPDIGKARRTLPVKIEGKPLELAFNARFLLDFLGVVATERVSFQATSAVHPARLEPLGEGDTYTYIVMPINL